MALSLATVGTKITAAFMNLIIAMVNRQGSTSVIPTSVAVTGGGSSASVGAAGKVTFAVAATLSVNGCFTSEFDNYRIQIEVPTVSATLTITSVLRVGGVDATAANYDLEVLQGQSAAAAAAAGTAGTAWTFSAITATIHDMTIELKRPFLTSPTYGTSFSMGTQNPQTAPGVSIRGLSHRLSTSYDGFTLTFTGGTATGTIRIYGWNNN